MTVVRPEVVTLFGSMVIEPLCWLRISNTKRLKDGNVCIVAVAGKGRR